MDEPIVQIELNHSALKIMYRAVERYLEKWPGGDPVEQESIRHIRQQFKIALLEFNYMTDVRDEPS